MMVDGTTNAVDEVDAVRVPTGPVNPYGNGFTRAGDPAAHANREAPG